MAVSSTRLVAGESLLIPHLPNDVSVQCIARVPRSSHPALVLVSRSWRSLLRSPQLFAVRSQLGTTEPSLCISIEDLLGESRLYFLNLRPCRLLPIPPPPFPIYCSAYAVLGHSLYVLGGYFDPRAVQIFDPCLNLWTTGPPMGEPRRFPAASTLGSRIYVFGGCVPPAQPWADSFDPESGAWAEVLDPAARAWASLPRRPTHLRKTSGYMSGVFGGQVLLNNGLVFEPESAQPWATMPKALRSKRPGEAVVLEGILYSSNFRGKLRGYDPAASVWRPVVWMERKPPKYPSCAKLANLGGLLCLLWKHKIMERSGVNIPTEIHCVGVEITRTSCGGFRGSIAWREVLAMPVSDGRVRHLAVLEF